MIWAFELTLLVFLVVCALAALQVKDLIGSSIILGAFSFMLCLLWLGMGAVDVAFTEAAVGAGVSTVFFIATILHINRRSQD